MFRCIKVVLLSFVLVSVEGFSKQLDIDQLKSFSDQILQETKGSPQNIFKYLSKDLRIETNVGSSAQGVTLYFNKVEYIDLINKSLEHLKKSQESDVVDVFDFKIISPKKGEFTMTTYSKTKRRKVWSVFSVELVNGNIKIIKIVDSL